MDRPITATIREAFASGDFDKGQRLWTAYMAQARAAIERRSFTAAQMDEVTKLKEWVRCTLLMARGHARERLNTLHIAARYGGGDTGTSGPRLIATRF